MLKYQHLDISVQVSLALGCSLAAAQCGCVVQPCLAADTQVPVEVGSSSVTVLRTLVSPKQWGPCRYDKADKSCYPSSPLLSAELALVINKWWKAARRNQASARHGP